MRQTLMVPDPSDNSLLGPYLPADEHMCGVVQVSVFDKAAEMYSGDSCRMARLVGSKNCCQVHARLLQVPPCSNLL